MPVSFVSLIVAVLSSVAASFTVSLSTRPNPSVILEPHTAQIVADTLGFGDFEIIQFATVASWSPESAMELDNNGELVLACRQGLTRDQLGERGIEFAESQIWLLTMLRVLDEEDGELRTAIPLLDTDETAELRAETAAIAEEIAPQSAPGVEMLLNHLRAIGREGNAYSILFSYVIDGLVWDRFEERGRILVREITAERPFWSGEVWGVSPPRTDTASGTNSISDSGVALKVNWSEPAIPLMGELMFDWGAQGAIVETLVAESRVVPNEVREKLARFDLVSEDGRLTIPVIDEQPGNILYEAATALADQIADSALERLAPANLVSRFGFRSHSQALVVAYHELMWDLMEQWEASGLIQVPIALEGSAEARPPDVAALVFAVREHE